MDVNGKTFALAGRFEHMTHQELADALRERGATVCRAPGWRQPADALIAGSQPGRAPEEARASGAPVLTEGDIRRALGLTDTPGRLSWLREHLIEPSFKHWNAICAYLERWSGPDLQVGIDYACDHLERWPDELREAPARWVNRSPDEPRLRLARSLLLNAHEPSDIPARLDTPLLDGLTHLSIRSNSILAEARWASAILEARHVDTLRSLDLLRCPMGAEGVRLLAHSERLAGGHLRELVLAGSDVAGAEGLDVELARSPVLRGLTDVHLGDTGFSHQGVEAMFTSPGAPPIRHLNLSHNQLDDRAIDALLQSPQLHRLRLLYLERNAVTDRGLRALAASTDLAGLEVLDLNHNGVGDAGLIALARSPVSHSLKVLNLSRSGVTGAGLHALLDHPPPHLHCLDLSDSALTDDAVLRLAGSELIGRLIFLYLGRNDLSEEACDAIEEAWRGTERRLSLYPRQRGPSPLDGIDLSLGDVD